MHTGSCLCGAVAFELEGPLDAPLICHCTQCRKQSGHVFCATSVPNEALRMTGEAGLKWYRASDFASRGFCALCGSGLFWKADEGGHIHVAMGALDAPTGLHLARHVWTAFKGDYYDIDDGKPCEKEEGGSC